MPLAGTIWGIAIAAVACFLSSWRFAEQTDAEVTRSMTVFTIGMSLLGVDAALFLASPFWIPLL